MNADDALLQLGESTAEAVAGVLQMFAADAVSPGARRRRRRAAATRSARVPAPAVAASVSYVDGVTGGNVFVMPLQAPARSPRR